MTNATLASKCPVCGEHCTVRALCDPGEPAQISGPPEFCHPGSGPSIEEMGEVEYNCDCLENIEQNAPREKRPVIQRSDYQARMRQILTGELRNINATVGFQARAYAITRAVQMLAGACKAEVHLRNPDGSWAYQEVCPMKDAYEEAVYDVAASSDIEFDPWEPYVPDYDDRW